MNLHLNSVAGALSAVLLGGLCMSGAASAAPLSGAQNAAPVTSTNVDTVRYGGWGPSITFGFGPRYHGYYGRPYGYGYGYGGYYPRYGYYDGGYRRHHRHHGRRWAQERFKHPLGRR